MNNNELKKQLKDPPGLTEEEATMLVKELERGKQIAGFKLLVIAGLIVGFVIIMFYLLSLIPDSVKHIIGV